MQGSFFFLIPECDTYIIIITTSNAVSTGTDATHAEHIETIKSRMYVGLRPDGRFVPGHLGMGLVEGWFKRIHLQSIFLLYVMINDYSSGSQILTFNGMSIVYGQAMTRWDMKCRSHIFVQSWKQT